MSKSAKDKAASTTETRAAEQLEPFQWKPGQSGNPKGRPKGSRNKLAESFLEDLYTDWQANGAAVIATVRAERPQDYLKVVASILPKELNVNHNALEEMSDDDLAVFLDHIRAQLAATAPKPAAARAGSATKH